MNFLLTIIFLPFISPMTRYSGLVRSISSTQRVEVGDSVRLDCGIDWELGENIADRIRVLWTKVKAGEMAVMASYSYARKTVSYEMGVEAAIGEGSWSLILKNVDKSDSGLYYCQVCYIIRTIISCVTF